MVIWTVRALELVQQRSIDALVMLQSYTNHDIVRFLESIGAEFGACQNAHTSFDETVYELLLPTEDLAKGLSVFAEFASKIRQVALYMSPRAQFASKIRQVALCLEDQASGLVPRRSGKWPCTWVPIPWPQTKLGCSLLPKGLSIWFPDNISYTRLFPSLVLSLNLLDKGQERIISTPPTLQLPGILSEGCMRQAEG